YSHLLAARMMLGVGEATLGPAAHSILADKFPKKQMATALSIYTAGAVLGTGGSIAIGGLAAAYFMQFDRVHFWLLGDLRPWQAVFACIGVPGLVLALLVFSFREPERLHPHTGGPRAALTPFLRKRAVVLGCFAGSFALLSMLLYGSLAWMPAYMERAFNWGPERVGPSLGIINVIAAGIGTIGGGIAVDWVVSRGHKDAHLKVFFTAVLLGVPVGVAGFLVNDPIWFLACMFWLKMMVFSYIGYAAAAVQAVTPQSLRGRMAAIYLLALALIGNGCGPSLVAFFTDYVFHDPQKLGLSMATGFTLITPIALFFAWLGMKPMREAVEAQRAEDALLEAGVGA
ncbi:MAG: MFS transporter, partial [Ignavibacteriales bacterium]